MSQEKSLNRQIAELLGYTSTAVYLTEEHKLRPPEDAAIVDPNGRTLNYTGCWGATFDEAIEGAWDALFNGKDRLSAGRNNDPLPPFWATNTDAAISLLDTLPRGLGVEIHRFPAGLSGEAIWYCEITSRTDGRLAWSVGRCNTQAEAVCRAFIEYKQKASQSS